jgi:hypothetical protein
MTSTVVSRNLRLLIANALRVVTLQLSVGLVIVYSLGCGEVHGESEQLAQLPETAISEACGPPRMQSGQEYVPASRQGLVLSFSSYKSMSDALTAIGATPVTLLISTAAEINVDLVIPATITVEFEAEGQLSIAGGHLVTINGKVEAAPLQHIFTGNGQANLSRSAIHHVPWWGMTAGDKNDHQPDFAKIIKSINAAGGGTINFPPGVYRIFNQENAPEGTPGYFTNLTGVTILGYGATLEIDPANTYLSEQGNASWFHFINSRDIFIDGFCGTGRNPVTVIPGIFTGVVFAEFEQGCQNITMPSVRLYGGWQAALITRRSVTDPESYISRGFRLGIIDVTGTIYGINSQFSGEDMQVDLLRTNGVYRSFFIYGTKHVKAKIQSTNPRSQQDVPIAAHAGVGLEDVDIEYSNVGSTFSGQSYGVVLTHAGHTIPTLIKDVRVKLNVKYAPTNYMGYAFSYRKALDDSTLDTQDRGHTLSNLSVTGLIDGTPAYGVPVAIGEPGTAWGAGESIYDIFLNDLYVVNNSQFQPIMTSLIMPALKGRIVQ